MASGSQVRTMRAISHRITRSVVRIGADQLSDVADGRGLGLDLPALGSHAGAFRLEGGSTG